MIFVSFQEEERPSLIPRLISHRKHSKQTNVEKEEVNCKNGEAPKKNETHETLKGDLKLLQKVTMNQVDTLYFTVPYL